MELSLSTDPVLWSTHACFTLFLLLPLTPVRRHFVQRGPASVRPSPLGPRQGIRCSPSAGQHTWPARPAAGGRHQGACVCFSRRGALPAYAEAQQRRRGQRRGGQSAEGAGERHGQAQPGAQVRHAAVHHVRARPAPPRTCPRPVPRAGAPAPPGWASAVTPRGPESLVQRPQMGSQWPRPAQPYLSTHIVLKNKKKRSISCHNSKLGNFTLKCGIFDKFITYI